MKAQFSHVHWGRILLTSILVVILVIIFNTVLVWPISLIWHQPDQRQIVYQVVSWSTNIVALLLTVGGALWVARKAERAAPLHGFLVGLVAALILLPLGKATIDLVALVIFVLMIAAGWLGGVLGSRGREKS
jgi:putative membrane protein (TIGR04086 family)